MEFRRVLFRSGQTIILGGVSNQIALGLKLLAVGAACRQAVRHLFERNLYGLFVLRDAYVFLDFSIIQIGAQAACLENGQRRSEEHTSELQSLMRNSYAVFCLKKKSNHHNR